MKYLPVKHLQQRKVAETWDTLIKHFRGRNILGKIGRTVRRREIGYRVGIRSRVWHYIRVRHVGEKISTVEKCENYWYCRDHISLSEDIDVALARTSRLRIYLFPILTRSASWEHGPIGERRSDTEGRDAPSQRKGYQSADGSDIFQQYFSIIACYGDLYGRTASRHPATWSRVTIFRKILISRDLEM